MRLMTRSEREIGKEAINREIAKHSRVINAYRWGGATRDQECYARKEYDKMIKLREEFLKKLHEKF